MFVNSEYCNSKNVIFNSQTCPYGPFHNKETSLSWTCAVLLAPNQNRSPYGLLFWSSQQGFKRKEFKSGRIIKSFNTTEWDTFGNHNIFGTLKRYLCSLSWLLLLDIPPKSLSQAEYCDHSFAILTFNYYK